MQFVMPRPQALRIDSPNQLDGLALWLDAIDQNSLLASDGSVIEDGEAVALWSDKSGNSAENCLVLNGVAGNYASAPDSAALNPPGNFAGYGQVIATDYTPSALARIITHSGGTGNRGFLFSLDATGSLDLRISYDGTNILAFTSTAAVGFADLVALKYLGFECVVNNGSGGTDVEFFTSDDAVSWVKLGDTVTVAGTGVLYDTSAVLGIGAAFDGNNPFSGLIYRAALLSGGLDGTALFDADFTTASKLATSFTESSSNAATVTINTTGATGARISGARDLYQGTVANRPLYSVSERSVTSDGTNDYLKAQLFSLSQPVTVYAAMQQVTWTSGDYLWGGNTADTLSLIQTTSTPQLNISAGTSTAANTGLVVATNGVVSAVYNGASSSLRINRGTATTGNAGTGTANGFTLGSKADGTAPGNGKYYEVLVYSGAHDTATRDRITQYLGRKWGISV